eukprot:755961-Hanusia_phi.AAC.6
MIGSPRPRPLQQHRVGRRLLQAESHVGPDVICEQVCELVSERGSGLDPEGGVLVHQSRQVKVHHRKHSRQNAESALLGGGEPRREEPEAEGTCCGQDKPLERPADGADLVVCGQISMTIVSKTTHPHRRIRLHRPVQQEVHLPSGNNAADRLAVHVQEILTNLGPTHTTLSGLIAPSSARLVELPLDLQALCFRSNNQEDPLPDKNKISCVSLTYRDVTSSVSGPPTCSNLCQPLPPKLFRRRQERRLLPSSLTSTRAPTGRSLGSAAGTVPARSRRSPSHGATLTALRPCLTGSSS